MRFLRSKWGRVLIWALLIAWPAFLPHPANAVVGCIWYTVLGLSALIYFITRIDDDTAESLRPAVPVAAGSHDDERDDQPSIERTPTSTVAPLAATSRVVAEVLPSGGSGGARGTERAGLSTSAALPVAAAQEG